MRDYGDYALLWANGLSWDGVLALHAHELAEEIRTLRGGTGEIAQAVAAAADLIDPEVEK